MEKKKKENTVEEKEERKEGKKSEGNEKVLELMMKRKIVQQLPNSALLFPMVHSLPSFIPTIYLGLLQQLSSILTFVCMWFVWIIYRDEDQTHIVWD